MLTDLAYGEEAHQRYDLFLPEAPGPVPGVLIIHGGGWCSLDRAGIRERQFAATLVEAGFACASIDYHLAPAGTRLRAALLAAWPRCLSDCVAALAHLRAVAPERGIDPVRWATLGGSAGGHLATLVALGAGGGTARAAVALYGIHDCLALFGVEMGDPERDRLLAASPVTHLTATSPPLLLIHGDADALVPPDQSRRIFAQARAVGGTAELVVVPGAPHSFHLAPPQLDLRPRVVEFLRRYLV
jgi:acetyl esterase/lipase